MDPFRDELAAAHEKIAELENQVAALLGRSQDPAPQLFNEYAVPRKRIPRATIFYTLISIFLFLVMAGVTVGTFLHIMSGSHHWAQAQNGLATTADPHQRAVAPASPPPSNHASSYLLAF